MLGWPRGADAMRPDAGVPASLLHELEEAATSGTLTAESLTEFARVHNVPLSTLQGLRTFYFPEEPRPRTEVCTGLPCALQRLGVPPRHASERDGAVTALSCLGYCAHAPVIRQGGRYFKETRGGVEEIEESTREFVVQHAERLSAYRGRGGYAALARFAADPDPGLLLHVLEGASLRGMGGAGFPVHLKWKAVLASKDPDRVIVVNAHEGEPGTFKDRLILEREPHRLLEGALLAGLALRASRIVIALKSEYANAQHVLTKSLEELARYVRDAGLDRSLPAVELRTLPGPYVTGEETALLEALEGRRSEPRLRPPFPAEAGLDGRPTLVQNVETLGALPRLFAGVEEGEAAGALKKDYCLTGDVERPGAYREPLGIEAASLVERDGGTAAGNLKAFLPGGPSGGILPASRLRVPLDFDGVKKEGSGLGTGAVVAIGRDRCIVDVLENITGFFAAESCGKCAPCRLGTAKLESLVAALQKGGVTEEDLQGGVALAGLLQETSICALGQVAGKAFLDGMMYFHEEIAAHAQGRCPARGPAGGRTG